MRASVRVDWVSKMEVNIYGIVMVAVSGIHVGKSVDEVEDES